MIIVRVEHVYPVSIDYPAALAELDREAAERARIWPERIRTGRMHQAEADRGAALWADIRAEVAIAATGDWRRTGEGAFAWREKLAELERVATLRGRIYPDWIATGRLTQAAADARDRALGMVHSLYWDHMLGWRPEAERAQAYWAARQAAGADVRGHPGRDAYFDEIRAHMHQLEAGRAPAPDLFEQAQGG